MAHLCRPFGSGTTLLTLGFQTPNVRMYLDRKNPSQKTKPQQVFGRLGLGDLSTMVSNHGLTLMILQAIVALTFVTKPKHHLNIGY